LFLIAAALGLDVATEETAVGCCSGMAIGVLWDVDAVGGLVTETAPDLNMGRLEMGSHCSVVTQSVRGYSGESGF
jgi:hypothetical protein